MGVSMPFYTMKGVERFHANKASSHGMKNKMKANAHVAGVALMRCAILTDDVLWYGGIFLLKGKCFFYAPSGLHKSGRLSSDAQHANAPIEKGAPYEKGPANRTGEAVMAIKRGLICPGKGV
ncbi:hypothetical protein [Gorillibacterium sp. CAU 1737]|uniref:hypothetical protein n=1 Tax=Gorillibacterium sp. CAU 1737 TaxID=3140362 RepID=UPI003260B507